MWAEPPGPCVYGYRNTLIISRRGSRNTIYHVTLTRYTNQVFSLTLTYPFVVFNMEWLVGQLYKWNPTQYILLPARLTFYIGYWCTPWWVPPLCLYSMTLDMGHIRMLIHSCGSFLITFFIFSIPL